MPQQDQLVTGTTVSLAPERAFDRFVELGDWWPSASTWSGDRVVDVRLDPRVGGMLSEIGPEGFRCDFGHVLAIERPRRLVFTWQIGPAREPQPDPARASDVEVQFVPNRSGGTEVSLTHRHFRRHGGGGDEYRVAMASEDGWPGLLRAFAGDGTGIGSAAPASRRSGSPASIPSSTRSSHDARQNRPEQNEGYDEAVRSGPPRDTEPEESVDLLPGESGEDIAPDAVDGRRRGSDDDDPDARATREAEAEVRRREHRNV